MQKFPTPVQVLAYKLANAASNLFNSPHFVSAEVLEIAIKKLKEEEEDLVFKDGDGKENELERNLYDAIVKYLESMKREAVVLESQEV